MREKGDRNREILKLNEQGFGARKLARMYKITPQRVSQIIKAQFKVTIEVSPGNSN